MFPNLRYAHMRARTNLLQFKNLYGIDYPLTLDHFYDCCQAKRIQIPLHYFYYLYLLFIFLVTKLYLNYFCT